MSPDYIKSQADRIHEDFSEDVGAIVKAAEEIRQIAGYGFNPYLHEILTPLFYDLSEDVDQDGIPTEVQLYRSMIAM